jgi:DNA repair exonuclease SbcCD ATPase subunit
VIRRIELVNFMSHAHTVIEPADGLTVLVGPNNCGKSAVVAALQILCHNDNSTYVTRHNEKECSVTVETDDGHIVEWCRKNNSPRYTVDGQLFDRLGRGSLPDGLHDVLRLPKVTAEGNQEFDVHFGEQKSPVFLLDKPGSQAAQFFASSSDAASLVEMQKRHQQKMVDARRERIQLEARAEKLATDLAVLAATDQIEIGVGQVESQHEELGRLASSIEQLTQDVRTLDQVIALSNRYRSEATALETLTLPPMFTSPQPLEDVIGALAQTQLDVKWQSARAASLAALQQCPDTTDDRPLGELIRNLNSARNISLRLDGECIATRELVPPPMMIEVETLRMTVTEIGSLGRDIATSELQLSALEALPIAPELNDEVSLTKELQALTRAVADLRRTETIHDHLITFTPAPEMVDTRDIEGTIHNLAGAAAAVASRIQELEQAEQALREGERLLRNWAEQQQLCPTCGSPLDPNQVVIHAGSCAGGHPHV